MTEDEVFQKLIDAGDRVERQALGMKVPPEALLELGVSHGLTEEEIETASGERWRVLQERDERWRAFIDDLFLLGALLERQKPAAAE